VDYARTASPIRKVVSTVTLAAALSVILLFSASMTAGAAGGNGTGGGGGTGGGTGGGNSPLTLTAALLATVNGNVSTSGAPVAGATLPEQPIIKLVFSVNVVADSVWPSPNQSVVTMVDSSGKPVAADVFRIDPAANADEKNNIFIRPSKALAPGGKYSVLIGPTLTGNNGQTLGTAATLSFVVAGTLAASPATSTAKAPVKKPASNASSDGSTLIIAGAIAAILIVAGGIIYRRVKNRRMS
jgi:hypothetical protein